MLKLVMGPLNWAGGILEVVAPTLVAEKKAAELFVAFFVGILVVLLIVYHENVLPNLVVRILEMCASTLVGNEKATKLSREVEKVNNSLYQLHPLPYKRDSDPNLQVLFFHGLLLGNSAEMHLSTWQNDDGCIWPKTWLSEEFPDAQILVVSYVKGLRKGSAERFNMDVISENLIQDLMQAGIGQKPYCPVVLIGHSFGGLIIKKLCMEAHYTPIRGSGQSNVKNFLGNLRGIFYYSTPHRGSNSIDKVKKVLKGPLFKYFESLSTEAAQLNHKFDNLRNSSYQRWHIEGLGEGCEVQSGQFKGYVVVPEASARDGDKFYLESTADHFSICRPEDKTSSRFKNLTTLLRSIDDEMKEEKKTRDEIRKKEEAMALKLTIRVDLQKDVQEKKLVGVEVCLKEVKARLEKFKTLGFIGMGGVGKTTLAMVVFNDVCHGFEYTCFIKESKAVQCNLEDEVWNHLHHNGRKVEGKKDWFDLREKRLLIVLDDILGDRDITFLSNTAKICSPESRFIVTTRERDKVLNSVEDLDSLEDIDIYDVPFLDKENSKELFMTKAFPNQENPTPEVVSVMEEIVRKCDGLPLTLTVLGSYLRKRKNIDVWTQTLRSLIQAETVTAIDEKLWAKLRLSYDSLGETEKQIFLDATTFFYGTFAHYTLRHSRWTLREAKAGWREAYSTNNEKCNELLLWQTLVDRCLVYDVGEDEHIKIHEQLLSLGRKIASESGKIRVWDQTTCQVSTLLQNNDESENKEFHALKLADGETIPDHALYRLKNFRYLEADFSGYRVGKSLPSELVVLKCRGLENLEDFLPADLRGRLAVLQLLKVVFLTSFIGQCSSLRILQLELRTLTRLDSQIQSEQIIPDEIGNLRQLEYLAFWSSLQLQSLPETFGNLSNLRFLEILHCGELHSLPKSFGGLASLKHLRLENCRNLVDLSDSFGDLSSLERLELRKCESLYRLPDSFGKLSKLTHLLTNDGYSLNSLPDSFGNLSALEHLELHNCLFEALPDSFGDLTSLEHLQLRDCDRLCRLPDSFGNLSKLKHLQIRYCYPLSALPESFGNLSALEHLELIGCRFEALPKSFGKLLKLTHLEFTDCSNWVSLIPFGQFKELHYLKISGFEHIADLDKLPSSIGELKALHHLILFNISIKSMPNWIKTMQALKTLELGQLPFVQDVPSWLREQYEVLSHKVFHIQDGHFTVASEKTATSAEAKIKTLHKEAVKMMEKSYYERAFQLLSPYNLGELEPQEPKVLVAREGHTKKFKGRSPRCLGRSH